MTPGELIAQGGRRQATAERLVAWLRIGQVVAVTLAVVVAVVAFVELGP